MPTEAARYVALADRFGWTPRDVDDLPLWLDPWVIPIHDVMQQVANSESRRPVGTSGPVDHPAGPGVLNLAELLPPPEEETP